MVQEQVAELEAKLAKLTAEFNAANTDKQEVRIASMMSGLCLIVLDTYFKPSNMRVLQCRWMKRQLRHLNSCSNSRRKAPTGTRGISPTSAC